MLCTPIHALPLQTLDGGDTLIHHHVELCTSRYNFYFLAVVYSTKGLLLAFGCFLAWETKKVTIPALNDSHNIGMCIYNVVILSVIGVILAWVLEFQVTLNYVLISALLMLGTTITQMMVFIPKVIILLRTLSITLWITHISKVFRYNKAGKPDI